MMSIYLGSANEIIVRLRGLRAQSNERRMCTKKKVRCEGYAFNAVDEKRSRGRTEKVVCMNSFILMSVPSSIRGRTSAKRASTNLSETLVILAVPSHVLVQSLRQPRSHPKWPFRILPSPSSILHSLRTPEYMCYHILCIESASQTMIMKNNTPQRVRLCGSVWQCVKSTRKAKYQTRPQYAEQRDTIWQREDSGRHSVL